MNEGDVTARCTCQPIHSSDPVVHTAFQRRTGHDQAGGGVVIRCEYVLSVRFRDIPAVIDIFEQYIPRIELDNRCFL